MRTIAILANRKISAPSLVLEIQDDLSSLITEAKKSIWKSEATIPSKTRLGSSVTKTLDFEADRPQTRIGSSATKTLDFEANRPQIRLGSSMTKSWILRPIGLKRGSDHPL